MGSGAEVALNVATTLDNATVVRVINLTGGDATVSVAKSTSAGYASTATVTLPDNRVEFFEKGAVLPFFCLISSTKVFQFEQPGHLPNHFGAS